MKSNLVQQRSRHRKPIKDIIDFGHIKWGYTWNILNGVKNNNSSALKVCHSVLMNVNRQCVLGSALKTGEYNNLGSFNIKKESKSRQQFPILK